MENSAFLLTPSDLHFMQSSTSSFASSTSSTTSDARLAIMTVTKSMKGTPYWMAPEAILQTGHSLSIESSVNALASSGFLFGDGG
ncbi:hypothetical protein KY285_027151 [Solanum tuberosum]|nr:hypothetical protein KY285_027151 [Solanum tuberosum]